MKKIFPIIAFILCYNLDARANVDQEFLFMENSHIADTVSANENPIASENHLSAMYYPFEMSDLPPCDYVPPGFPCFDPDPGTVPVGEGIGVLIILSLLYGLIRFYKNRL